MEILKIMISSIFNFLNHSFNVLGYQITLWQVFVVSAILGTIGKLWNKMQD